MVMNQESRHKSPYGFLLLGKVPISLEKL